VRVLCIRSALVRANPWLPNTITEAFTRSKDNALQRLITAGMSRYPLPWINDYVERTRRLFGDDFWPYGIDENRPTLSVFLNQSGLDTRLSVEDLFTARQ
jgi:4,5-dihydroxyphthalate decarboxylase